MEGGKSCGLQCKGVYLALGKTKGSRRRQKFGYFVYWTTDRVPKDFACRKSLPEVSLKKATSFNMFPLDLVRICG